VVAVQAAQSNPQLLAHQVQAVAVQADSNKAPYSSPQIKPSLSVLVVQAQQKCPHPQEHLLPLARNSSSLVAVQAAIL
jgi:hypothetical protein